MKFFAPLLFLLVLLAPAGFAQNSIKVGTVAPAFTGSTLDGTSLELAQFRGKVVVMTFWSTRCPVCHSEMPKLNRFADRFASDKVVMLAFTMENEEKVKGYLRNNHISFRVVPNSFGTLFAYADRDSAGYVDIRFPAFFVIDQQGTVQHRSSGYDKTEPMASVVQQLLTK